MMSLTVAWISFQEIFRNYTNYVASLMLSHIYQMSLLMPLMTHAGVKVWYGIVGFNIPIIGHFENDFSGSDDPTNSVAALKDDG